MAIKELFKTKPNESTEKYEILSKSIEELERSVQKINEADLATKLDVLYSKLDIINNFLSKLKFRNNLEGANDVLAREVADLKSQLYVANIDLEHKKTEVEQLEKANLELTNKYNSVQGADDIEKIKSHYNELLGFAFRNLNPYAPFDKDEARFYWENLVK